MYYTWKYFLEFMLNREIQCQMSQDHKYKCTLVRLLKIESLESDVSYMHL